MSREKTEILFTLGDASANHRDWPDYLELGFDQGDVPALLELVTDKELHDAPGASHEVWVPLHAWRTLGQLRSADAVLPLIELFDELVENDWALSELPKVLGMIGASAITPLAERMNDAARDEFVRVMAMDGLCEVARHRPAQRDEVLRHYQRYLAQPDTTTPALNGLLVGRLLDLEAKELIEAIRSLFDQHCVDISCAGDLEAVEIELGFRSNRSTPKPPPFEMYGIPPLTRPKGDDAFELLEYYLDRYGGLDSIADLSEMDGFFAALGCSPAAIMPSRWLPAIWGGEEEAPEWKSKQEFEEFASLVFPFYSQVMESMHDGVFEALFMTQEVAGETCTLVEGWCIGFLRGVNLWGPLASADAVVVERALEPMRLFATERGAGQLQALTTAEIENHQAAIEPNVRQLFSHFFKQRKDQHIPLIRDTPKIGRNDPCPCGSGKKFKKCCLY